MAALPRSFVANIDSSDLANSSFKLRVNSHCIIGTRNFPLAKHISYFLTLLVFESIRWIRVAMQSLVRMGIVVVMNLCYQSEFN